MASVADQIEVRDRQIELAVMVEIAFGQSEGTVAQIGRWFCERDEPRFNKRNAGAGGELRRKRGEIERPVGMESERAVYRFPPQLRRERVMVRVTMLPNTPDAGTCNVSPVRTS